MCAPPGHTGQDRPKTIRAGTERMLTSEVSVDDLPWMSSTTCGLLSQKRGPVADCTTPPRHLSVGGDLEVEAEFGGIGPRGHKMRPAERRQEVVKRGLVRQVDHGEASAPFVAVPVEQVVVAGTDVEQVTRSNARRIVVVVFGAGSGKADARRVIERWIARRQRCSQGRHLASANQAGLDLLVRGEARQIDQRRNRRIVRYR